MLSKALYIREVARYPGVAVFGKLTHCHSSQGHCAHTVGMGIFTRLMPWKSHSLIIWMKVIGAKWRSTLHSLRYWQTS